MWEAAGDLAAAIERALGDLAAAVAGAAPGWLALGVALHVANQVARGRGWHALIRAATPQAARVRPCDAIAAWVAGAGAGGIASARGGDAVRVLLLRRRMPAGSCPLLAGTLVAEGAGELATGAAILAVIAAIGLAPVMGAPGPGAAWVLAATVAGAIAVVLAVRRCARLRAFAARVGQGCAPLRAPGRYAREVLPWQLASRLLRALALWCLLAAFGLPASVAAVLLVMAAQGGGRLLPFAPASVGAGAAVLVTTFPAVTGSAVSAAAVTAFFVGTSAVLTAVGATLTVAICARTVGLRRLRAALRPAAPGAARI